MNVLILLGSLNRGGTENLMLDVLNNRNYIPTVNLFLVSRKRGQLYDDFIKSEVDYKQIKLKSLKSLFELRKFIKSRKIQIVHANQALDVILVKLALLFLNVKIVYTIHHFDFSMTKKQLRFFRLALKFARKIIFVSAYQKKYFDQKYKIARSKSILVYNGINFERFDEVKIYNSIKSELKVKKEEILIASIGNFVFGRDQLMICKFLEKLKKSKTEFKFLFIGEKNETKNNFYAECYDFCEKNNLLENVVFLGSRNDVPQILNEIDAFVYASLHDSFGIAVLEAIYSVKKVFLNDWPVMNELSNQGKYATIYKTKDENDLFDKFNRNFEQLEEIYILEKKKYLQNKFQIKNHLVALEQLYLSLK